MKTTLDIQDVLLLRAKRLSKRLRETIQWQCVAKGLVEIAFLEHVHHATQVRTLAMADQFTHA